MVERGPAVSQPEAAPPRPETARRGVSANPWAAWGGVALLAVVLTAATGCAADAGSGGAVAPGTARMADTLAAYAAAARAEPMPYFVLNTDRADRLEASLSDYRGTDLLRARFDLARERLDAGATDEAIRHLVDLGEAAGGRPALVANPGAKPVYDLLATAYLRRGEQANCIANHHAGEVCVLPFRGGAVHADPDGAERAADVLVDVLAAYPDDLGSRWLLNVAHQALGTYPSGVPEPYRIAGLDSTAAGPLGRWRNVAPHRGADVNGLSGGVSANDFDGDGDPDLLVTSYGLEDPVRYLENTGGQFADRTEAAGLEGITGGLNTVHGDVDGDGDPDVLVLRGGWFGRSGAWPNSLLRNDGGGHFTDVTYDAGLGEPHPTQTAAFADVDGDGDLDLFVGNESGGAYPDALGRTPDAARHPSELFLNDGAGRFREAAAESGIDLAAFVKGSAWGDADGDGRPDLYVSVLGGANKLYLNRTTPPTSGEGATRRDGAVRFEEGAEAAGVAGPDFSFPVAWFDADGDGRDDLLVVSYDARRFYQSAEDAAREALGLPALAETTRLFLNRGDGTFRDASAEAGLALPLYGMGLGVGDLDGDGRLDVYVGTGAPELRALVPNRAFLNRSEPGAPRFEDVTLSSGLGHLQKGHAVAFLDADGDGDEEVYAVLGGAVEGDVARNALFDGPTPPGAGWLSLVLEGRQSNRSAIGARVAVTVRRPDGTARTLHRTVGTGGSFGAGTLALNIGLDDAVAVESVVVRWPGGGAEAFPPPARGARLRLVQGTGTAPPGI